MPLLIQASKILSSDVWTTLTTRLLAYARLGACQDEQTTGDQNEYKTTMGHVTMVGLTNRHEQPPTTVKKLWYRLVTGLEKTIQNDHIIQQLEISTTTIMEHLQDHTNLCKTTSGHNCLKFNQQKDHCVATKWPNTIIQPSRNNIMQPNRD